MERHAPAPGSRRPAARRPHASMPQQPARPPRGGRSSLRPDAEQVMPEAAALAIRTSFDRRAWNDELVRSSAVRVHGTTTSWVGAAAAGAKSRGRRKRRLRAICLACGGMRLASSHGMAVSQFVFRRVFLHRPQVTVLCRLET